MPSLFEYAAIALFFASFWCACLAVVVYAIYRFIRYRKISSSLIVITSLAMRPLSLVTIKGVIEGDIELNPDTHSRGELVGIYSNGDQCLQLNADGTFVSAGISPVTSGTWRSNSPKLILSNTGLEGARFVTRNGLLCIAPFYAGVDGPLGILLKKHSPQSRQVADLTPFH